MFYGFPWIGRIEASGRRVVGRYTGTPEQGRTETLAKLRGSDIEGLTWVKVVLHLGDTIVTKME